MRLWAVGWAAAVLMLGSTGCQRTAPLAAPQAASQPPVTSPRQAPAAIPEPVSFKGMELYSLKAADGRWHYYVLGGTNRQKRLSEVTASTSAIGTEAAKLYLRSLPPGSSISWNVQVIVDRPAVGNPGLPDSETVKQIRDVCRQSGIDLILPGAGLPTGAATFSYR